MSLKDKTTSAGQLNDRRVLVIDDVPFNRLLPGLVLRPFGVEVFECAHVHEAFPLLEKERVDVVLLDISMPGTDGIESLAILKSHPVWTQAKIRVYAYTAYADPDKEQELLGKGFDGVLHKPVKNQKLIDLFT